MSKFNVGDRVEVTEVSFFDCDFVSIGSVGVVSHYTPDCVHAYTVTFPQGEDYFPANRLALIAPERSDVPTVFRLEVPAEPAGVSRVRPVGYPDHIVFERHADGWFWRGVGTVTWKWMLSNYPDGFEPVPDADHDYRVSLDYLRRNPHLLDELTASGVTGMHAAAVVRGVLEGEG